MNRRKFLVESVISVGSLCLAGVLNANDSTMGFVNSDLDLFVARILKADVPNSVGHIYPKIILDKIIENFKNKQELYGRLEPTVDESVMFHGQGCKLAASEISHKVISVFMDGNYLMVKGLILKTPRGKVLSELMSPGNHAVSFRTTGAGRCYRHGNDILVDGDSYKLWAVDAWPYYKDKAVVGLDRNEK